MTDRPIEPTNNAFYAQLAFVISTVSTGGPQLDNELQSIPPPPHPRSDPSHPPLVVGRWWTARMTMHNGELLVHN